MFVQCLARSQLERVIGSAIQVSHVYSKPFSQINSRSIINTDHFGFKNFFFF